MPTLVQLGHIDTILFREALRAHVGWRDYSKCYRHDRELSVLRLGD
jgi:hypothetical protein